MAYKKVSDETLRMSLLRKTESEGVDWIKLAQNRIYYRCLVNMVMTFDINKIWCES